MYTRPIGHTQHVVTDQGPAVHRVHLIGPHPILTRGFSITPGPFPSSARTSSSRSGLPLCALSPLPPDGIRRTVTVGARRERAAAIRRTERRRRGVRLGTAGRSPHRRRNPRPARAFSPLRPRASSSPPGSNGLEFSPPKERRLAFPFFLGFCLSPQHDA